MPNFSWVVLNCKKFFKHSGCKILIKCMIFKYLILFLGCLLTFLMVFWLSWWRFEVFKKIYWSAVDLQFCIFTIQQSYCFIYTHTHSFYIFFHYGLSWMLFLKFNLKKFMSNWFFIRFIAYISLSLWLTFSFSWQYIFKNVRF